MHVLIDLLFTLPSQFGSLHMYESISSTMSRLFFFFFFEDLLAATVKPTSSLFSVFTVPGEGTSARNILVLGERLSLWHRTRHDTFLYWWKKGVIRI